MAGDARARAVAVTRPQPEVTHTHTHTRSLARSLAARGIGWRSGSHGPALCVCVYVCA